MATKGQELMDSDADIRKSSSSIVSRIYVEGYDNSLSGYDFVMSMRKHFASCGEVLHVYIPGYVEGFMLNGFVLIYLRGEGAEEKASRLNGTFSGGHKLVVEPYPFHATHLDHKFAPMRKEDNKWSSMIYVGGYDTSLAEDYVKSKLVEHLSQCGRVLGVDIPKVNGDVLFREAFVTVIGIDTIEKAMQLGGCDVKGLENVKVSGVANPSKDGESTGNMIPLRYWTDGSSSTPVMPPGDPNLPQPPDLATLRSHPWYSRFDERAGLFRIWNKENGIQYDLPPSPASKVGYASEDPSLPKPWKGLVDLSTGYKYFWNTETNVTQYKRPPPS